MILLSNVIIKAFDVPPGGMIEMNFHQLSAFSFFILYRLEVVWIFPWKLLVKIRTSQCLHAVQIIGMCHDYNAQVAGKKNTDNNYPLCAIIDTDLKTRVWAAVKDELITIHPVIHRKICIVRRAIIFILAAAMESFAFYWGPIKVRDIFFDFLLDEKIFGTTIGFYTKNKTVFLKIASRIFLWLGFKKISFIYHQQKFNS